MIPVLLTHIKTQDGITLDGIVIQPKRKSKTALIWLHGLTSSFYFSQTLIKKLSDECQAAHIGYFKFNMRGHDIVARGHEGLLGTLFEKFEDSVYDIRAIIRFARSLGYKDIILAGHSTGANKAVYYLHKTKDRYVKGLVLLGALNDIAAETQRVGKKEFLKNVRLAKNLQKKNPSAFFESKGFLFTANRYLSLHMPRTAEDVFPYYDQKAQWKELASIRIPISLIIGSRDEYLGIPLKKYIEAFRVHAASTKAFSSAIIKGANHSFRNQEYALTRAIMQFIKRAVV